MILNKIIIFVLLLSTFAIAKSAQESIDNYSQSAVVFTYHRFGESKYRSTNITIEQFQYQIDYLEKNNYNVWPLSKIINHLQKKKPIPKNTVALTMDDAYKSVYTDAYPMLKKKNFPFTVFVNTQPIDNGSSAFVTWDQIREMKENGGEFANHSLTHDNFLIKDAESKKDWKKRITKEVGKAQIRLNQELGYMTNELPRMFAYPFGEYDEATSELIKELDYVGLTQLSGAIGFDSDFGMLNRFPMAERFATENGFKTKLSTLPLPIESLSRKNPVLKATEANPPKLRIKLKEPISRMGCFTACGDPIDMNWISKTEVEINAKDVLEGPRNRYTCTAPAKDSKWYWYSHLWIIE